MQTVVLMVLTQQAQCTESVDGQPFSNAEILSRGGMWLLVTWVPGQCRPITDFLAYPRSFQASQALALWSKRDLEKKPP